MTTLENLAAAIEAGAVGQFRNLDSDFGKGNGIHAKRAYNGSLDAAKALHEEMLPGWFWYGGYLDGPADGYCFSIAKTPYIDGPSFRAFDEIPARAWLLAIVRTLIAKEAAQ